ncbi:MAG: J domain-containing protein [Lachnospiraceae bacterium]|nr:J domain-containing protein [Lachnospiraceae bacterium]
MNELRILKVAELRKKLAVIPVKLLFAAGLVILLAWDTDLKTVWEHAKLMPGAYFRYLIICYGIVSYVYFFIRLLHGPISGILVSAAVAVVAWSQRDYLTGAQQQTVLYIAFLGGPVFDILRWLRYLRLREEVVREEEDLEEASYGRGYDRGYESGYERASGEARRRMEEEWEFRERYERVYSRIEEETQEGYEDRIPYREEDRREPSGFFGDCTDEASIKRRYRDLCKVYHPDNGNGSERIFLAIKEEYEDLMNGG